MSSVEMENKKTINENIIPRIEILEREQQAITAQMGILANQMKAIELSNNDVKQTVVGYGQTHSMLLKSAMDSMVQINAQNAQIVREVQTTTKEVQTTKAKVDGQIQQTKLQNEGEVTVAKLGAREKTLVAVLAIPGFFSFVPKAYTFIIDLFK